jgi:hypothetical protein
MATRHRVKKKPLPFYEGNRMSSPASHPEATHGESFTDMKSHQQMYVGYTHLITRGIVGVIVVLLLIGFITGTL